MNVHMIWGKLGIGDSHWEIMLPCQEYIDTDFAFKLAIMRFFSVSKIGNDLYLASMNLNKNSHCFHPIDIHQIQVFIESGSAEGSVIRFRFTVIFLQV